MIKTSGKYFFKTKCKRKAKVRGDTTPPPSEVSWKLKYKIIKWIRSRNSNSAVVVVSVVIVIVNELT
jgi:hypothetical protein